MKRTILRTGAILAIGLAFTLDGAVAAPAGFGGAAHMPALSSISPDAGVTEVQMRRRGGGGRVGVAPRGRFVPGGGGRRRGLSSGAAIGLGVGAAALGILGAAAAANAHPAPAPVYDAGECYWVRRPMYDDWGNYIGRRRVRVCD